MYQPIKGESNIRTAILMLHPVAKEAAQTLIGRLPEEESVFGNTVYLETEMQKCMVFAGVNNGLDRDRIENLVQSQGHAVCTVAVSVIQLQITQRKWGWVKRAAGIGLGILVGSLFG